VPHVAAVNWPCSYLFQQTRGFSVELRSFAITFCERKELRIKDFNSSR